MTINSNDIGQINAALLEVAKTARISKQDNIEQLEAVRQEILDPTELNPLDLAIYNFGNVDFPSPSRATLSVSQSYFIFGKLMVVYGLTYKGNTTVACISPEKYIAPPACVIGQQSDSYPAQVTYNMGAHTITFPATDYCYSWALLGSVE